MGKKITLKMNITQAKALAQALDYCKEHFNLGMSQEMLRVELEKQIQEHGNK